MKHLIIFTFTAFTIFLYGFNSIYAKLLTEINLISTEEMRNINEDSLLNPDNNIQHIAKNAAIFETHLTLSDYLNEQQTLRWLFKSYSFYSSELDATDERLNFNRIDELFTDWKYKNWFLSVGKRRINLGTALAFNPVNVIVPPRDPLNPKQETEGQPLAWVNFNSGDLSTDLFFTRNYDKKWNSNQNRWGTRLGIILGTWDLSGYYFADESNNIQNVMPQQMSGLALSTNLIDGITLYSEMALFNNNYKKYYDINGMNNLNNERYMKGVIGSYIVLNPDSFLSFFNGDANLTMEAYYNGSGYTKSERKYYFTTLNQTPSEKKFSVMKDYIFTDMSQYYYLIAYRNNFKERYTIGLSGLLSQDMSGSLQGLAQYDLSDYYTLKIKITNNSGDEKTEFGNAPVSDQVEISLDINF